MGQNATASPEASERPETSATPETAATNDMAVAFAALGAELEGLLELPAEAPANDELRQNREERKRVWIHPTSRLHQGLARSSSAAYLAIAFSAFAFAAGQPGSACGKGNQRGLLAPRSLQSRGRDILATVTCAWTPSTAPSPVITVLIGACLKVRDALRQRPLVTREDVTNTLTLLAALGSLAGQARAAEIGSKLEKHPRAGAGETDLSFERIRVELKSQNDRPLSLTDCQRFVGQTSSYAVGSDKRVAVLCVLDGSRKVEQPFPAEDGLGILKTEDDLSAVVTVLIQGNLARPSVLSRRTESSG